MNTVATEHAAPTAAPAEALNVAVARPFPATPPLPFNLGQLYPEHGGVYVGACRSDVLKSQGWHIFVAIDPSAEFVDIKFGGYGHRVAGADSHSDGMANTIALADDSVDHPAAKACRAFTLGEINDYYLPSHNELMLCWINASEHFNKDDYYWSSTQLRDDRDSAWNQYFDDGYSDINDKEYQARVRPVRRLVI